jgi:hypothetical protein
MSQQRDEGQGGIGAPGGIGGPGGPGGWGIESDWARWVSLGALGLLLALIFYVCQGDEGEPPADADDRSAISSAAGSFSPVPAGTDTPAAATTSEATTEPTSSDGESMRVGNIEIELIEVQHPYDATEHSPLNTANTRIDLAVTALGDGGGYFTSFELSIADDTGAEYGTAPCLDCPGDAVSMPLGEGETGEGSAYFELPAGREPAELIYRSSAGGGEGSLSLR